MDETLIDFAKGDLERALLLMYNPTYYLGLLLIDDCLYHFNMLKNKEFLRIIDCSRIEIMFNEFCYPICQRRKEHYVAVDVAQLNNSYDRFVCEHHHNNEVYSLLRRVRVFLL